MVRTGCSMRNIVVVFALVGCGSTVDTWPDDLAKETCRYAETCTAAAFNEAYTSFDDCVVRTSRASAEAIDALPDTCLFFPSAASECLAGMRKTTSSCAQSSVPEECAVVITCDGEGTGGGNGGGGNGGGNGGGGNGGDVDESGFAKAYADAVCGFYDSCGGGVGGGIDCAEQVGAAWEQALGAYKGCNYDAKAASSCIDDLNAAKGTCNAQAIASAATDCAQAIYADCGGGGGNGGNGGDTANW